MAINGSNDWTSTKPISIESFLHPLLVQRTLADNRPYDVFHPSEWGSCIRKTAYRYYNYKQPFVIKTAKDIDSRSVRIFDNGDYMHARWQKYLDDAGILRGRWKCKKCGKEFGSNSGLLGIFNPAHEKGWNCQCGNNDMEYVELPVQSLPEYNFSGHCDAVVDVSGTPLKRGCFDVFVIDFKSIKDQNFASLEGAEYKHAVQVNIYMWLLGLDGAIVLYENKNTQKIRECFVPRNDALIGTIKSETLALVDLLNNNKIPKRPAGMTPSKDPCCWCDFAKYCYR